MDSEGSISAFKLIVCRTPLLLTNYLKFTFRDDGTEERGQDEHKEKPNTVGGSKFHRRVTRNFYPINIRLRL